MLLCSFWFVMRPLSVCLAYERFITVYMITPSYITSYCLCLLLIFVEEILL